MNHTRYLTDDDHDLSVRDIEALLLHLQRIERRTKGMPRTHRMHRRVAKAKRAVSGLRSALDGDWHAGISDEQFEKAGRAHLFYPAAS
ncbi:MAG: hypothetical protein AAF514_12430 [Verrucomicrobiota bacterium]